MKTVFPIFQDPAAYETLITVMTDHIAKTHADATAVAGLDARGFLMGPAIAARLKLPFVPIRKKGKLPGECVAQSYGKEYGEDMIEIQKAALKPGAKVVLVDDLLATGGTLTAAANLITAAGCEAVGAVLIVGLPDLKGADKVPCPCWCILDREAGC